jgi:hypothetical protein
MATKLTPLRYSEHGGLHILPIRDYGFARGTLVVPIVIDEIGDVAREYPIVFPEGGSLPVALMGVEKGSNAYVSPDGRWRATYVPAQIRIHPLALARIPAGLRASENHSEPRAEEHFAVLVDVESPFISTRSGAPLFNPDESLSSEAQLRVDMMERLQNRVPITERLVQSIADADLFITRAIRLQKEGEADRQLTGVRVIDEAALNALDDEAFNKLRRAGALPLIYAALLSWANFRQGPIGKSHPLPSPPVMPDDEVIRFN